MYRMLLTSALLVGMGLAAGAEAKPSEDQKAREAAKHEAIEDILSKPLPEEAYAQRERCLASHQYDSVDILDDRHLVFKGRGHRIWVNELRNRCVGLRPRDVLQFEVHANRICDLDMFQAVDTSIGIKGGICSLGQFTPVTAEQVQAIKAAVAESRKR